MLWSLVRGGDSPASQGSHHVCLLSQSVKATDVLQDIDEEDGEGEEAEDDKGIEEGVDLQREEEEGEEE